MNIITEAMKSLVVLLYRNKLATTTTLKGKSYVPVRKINMFVDLGIDRVESTGTDG